MGSLIYASISSLDGYIEDRHGKFDWAAPDEEVHQFVNDLERSIGTCLYGRRMYEIMRFWETVPADDPEPAMREYGEIWRDADKVVYSTSLTEVSTSRTTLEATFEPDAVRALKESATADLSIGGPTLAAHALRAGLVDEMHQFLHPIVVGAGKHWLPADLGLELELRAENRFRSGVVHLHYRVVSVRDA